MDLYVSPQLKPTFCKYTHVSIDYDTSLYLLTCSVK